MIHCRYTLSSRSVLHAGRRGIVSGSKDPRPMKRKTPTDATTPTKRFDRGQVLRAVSKPKDLTEDYPTTTATAGNNGSGNVDLVDYSLIVYLQGAREQIRLHLVVVSEEDQKVRSEKFDLSKAKGKEYKREDATQAGTKFEINISLPADFKPGVALLNKFAEENKEDESPPFVATMTLQSKDSNAVTEYTAYSYIDIAQSDRVIFPASTAYTGIKGNTPAGLQHFRDQELKALRGTEADKTTLREGAQRIYDYDVYNDLADPTAEGKDRPVLGGVKRGNIAYPRRIRTGRPLDKNGIDESKPLNGDLPWLPLDERFNNEKFHAFTEDAQNVVGKVVRSVLGTPRGLSFALGLVPFIKQMFANNIDPTKPKTIFEDFGVVDAMFEGLIDDKRDGKHPLKDLLPVTRLKTFQVLDLLQQRFRRFDGGLRKALGLTDKATDADDLIDKIIEEKKKQAEKDAGVAVQEGAQKTGFFRQLGLWPQRKPPAPLPKAAFDDARSVEVETLGQKVNDVVELVHGLLERWPCPDVRQDKAIQWRTDEEFGRMALAGQNPFVIQAVTLEDLKKFAVRDSDVKTLLEGRSLEQAVKDDRLWVMDHHTAYMPYVKKVADFPGSEVLYAGRCILYTRNSDVTVPVAIELETQDQPLRVFTPNLCAEVWLLAKLVIASLDSGVHQLVSHWLRTHACVEPYIIATRRELSPLHPVYKILEPHFRYTMRINCNARKVLVNAGGIVEQSFTPGRYCMELSASVYQSWRFDEQGVPQDLEKRGLVKPGKNGKLESKIPNYPYADDALEIWDAIHTFVGDYLRPYYDGAKPPKKVTEDVELMAWWKAIKEEGHPDTTKGWPKLDSLGSLQDILATIMWVSSGHHAAVNFGQYLNSAYMPYMPSKIHRKIPDAGSPEEKELKNRFEKNLLQTLTDPVATVFVMVTTKILSAHASDEEYLDKDNHNYIKDKEGLKAHKKFVDALNAAEARMDERNKDPTKHRYSLLMPSNPRVDPSLDDKPSGRGIPYSISI